MASKIEPSLGSTRPPTAARVRLVTLLIEALLMVLSPPFIARSPPLLTLMVLPLEAERLRTEAL